MDLRLTRCVCCSLLLFAAPSGEAGNSESVFHVDKTVGTIIIAKPLDAEQQSFYNLTVQATDGTKAASTQVHTHTHTWLILKGHAPSAADRHAASRSLFLLQVHVTVMDTNDNAPVFSQPTYDVTVSEDIPPDTEVVQVTASDRDRHHQLTYSLQSSIDPSSMRFFRIHPALGTIYTLQSLDHEACALHILTITVSQNLQVKNDL